MRQTKYTKKAYLKKAEEIKELYEAGIPITKIQELYNYKSRNSIYELLKKTKQPQEKQGVDK